MLCIGKQGLRFKRIRTPLANSAEMILGVLERHSEYENVHVQVRKRPNNYQVRDEGSRVSLRLREDHELLVALAREGHNVQAALM